MAWPVVLLMLVVVVPLQYATHCWLTVRVILPLQAAQFVRDKLWDPQTSRLRRSFRLGPSAAAGYADDYAYLISGLLDLYQVRHRHGQLFTPHTAWLRFLDVKRTPCAQLWS